MADLVLRDYNGRDMPAYTGIKQVGIPDTNGNLVIFDDTSDATATTSDLLLSKTAYVNNQKIIGTMSNNGDVSNVILDKSTIITIPSGYTTGGTINIASTEQNKIIATNIKSGIEILGITGTYQGTWATGAPVTVTPYVISQTIMPADEGVDCFTEVDVNAIPYTETDNPAGGKTASICNTVYKIQSGTYVSKTNIANFVEATFNIPFTVTYGSTVDTANVLKIRYRELLGSWYWAGGYPSPSNPSNTTVFLVGYPSSAPTEWRFFTGSGTVFHVDATTIVTQSQYTIFNSYFTRTGA